MARTNIDIDDQACAVVMRRYQLRTKRDAVNFALRALAIEPLALDDARRLRGSGWEGDLDELRAAASWMILVDTSAWIEFLRDTGSAVCARVDEVLGADLAICDPIRMEILAGARHDAHLRELRGLLARASVLTTYPTDYEDAAALYRTCRRRGETVRKLIDCLIAAVAIRADVPVLHADADFDVLARHTPLRLDSP